MLTFRIGPIRSVSWGRSAAQWHTGEAGQTLALFGLAIVALVGFVGLSVDVGNKVFSRTHAQSDADAAALAAAGVLADGGSKTQAEVEAASYMSNKNTTVSVNIPPTSGPAAGDANFVEVVVTRKLTKHFIQVVYGGDWSTSARAVARFTPGETGFGVVALDEHACDALELDSSAKLTVSGGGVFVNSDCPTNAFETNSNVTAVADQFSITGNWKNGGSMPSPKPKTNQPRIPDPWANVPTPALPSNSVSTSCSGSSSKSIGPGVVNCAPMKMEGGATLTLSGAAGAVFVFRGGLEMASNTRLSIPNKAIVVLDGGGMMLGSGVQVSAPNGVLFYNKCYGGCTAKDRVYVTSNATLNVKPYGAPYANIVFFQQRNNANQMYFDAGVSMNVQGGIYAASARVYVDSNCTTPLQFVVGTLHIDSGATLTIDVEGMSTVKAPPTMALVE